MKTVNFCISHKEFMWLNYIAIVRFPSKCNLNGFLIAC